MRLEDRRGLTPLRAVLQAGVLAAVSSLLLLSCARTVSPGFTVWQQRYQQARSKAEQLRMMPDTELLLRMKPEERETVWEQVERNAQELPEPAKGIRLREATRARAMAQLSIGINGEIVVLTKRVIPYPEDYLLVRKHDGSAVITKVPLDPSAAVTLATVSSSGKIDLAEPSKAGDSSFGAFPITWPFTNGSLVAPQTGTVIMRFPEKSQDNIAVPPDALGWLYRGIEHTLNAPPKGTQPFPNVIWVHRATDGGLRLTHSGPDRQGLYASVSRDGRISFSDTTDYPKPGPGEDYYWRYFSSEEGLPVTLPTEWAWLPTATTEPLPQIEVNRFGMLIFQGGVTG